jgi:hypothetical protein
MQPFASAFSIQLPQILQFIHAIWSLPASFDVRITACSYAQSNAGSWPGCACCLQHYVCSPLDLQHSLWPALHSVSTQLAQSSSFLM